MSALTGESGWRIWWELPGVPPRRTDLVSIEPAVSPSSMVSASRRSDRRPNGDVLDSSSERTTRQRIVVAVLAFNAFGSASSGLVMAPLLVQVASEYNVSVGQAGVAVGIYGLPVLLLGVIVGPLADRHGRKRFLVGGSLLVGLGTLTAAVAPTLALLVSGRLIAGAGFALAGSTGLASIDEHFSRGQRGRALAMVVGTAALASLVTVPASGVLADVTSWRVPLGVLGALGVMISVVTVALLPPSRRSRAPASRWMPYRLVVGNRHVVTLLVAGLLGTVSWVTWETYLVTFLQTKFDVSQSVASLAMLTTGVGVLIGSQAGGRLGDRADHRRVLGVVLAASCAVVLGLTLIVIGLVVTLVLNLVFTTLMGARNVTHIALLNHQVPEARTTTMSILASLNGGAQLLGPSLGGLLLDTAGFWLVGVFCTGLFAIAVVVFGMYPAAGPDR